MPRKYAMILGNLGNTRDRCSVQSSNISARPPSALESSTLRLTLGLEWD